jgi:hypothetical protein
MTPDAVGELAGDGGLASPSVKPMMARLPGGTTKVRFTGLTAAVARPDRARAH